METITARVFEDFTRLMSFSLGLGTMRSSYEDDVVHSKGQGFLQRSDWFGSTHFGSFIY
jgi:hypothetical protein